MILVVLVDLIASVLQAVLRVRTTAVGGKHREVVAKQMRSVQRVLVERIITAVHGTQRIAAVDRYVADVQIVKCVEHIL